MITAKTAARSAAAGAALLALAACTDWAGHDLDIAQGAVPQLSTLRQSVRPDPQDYLRLPAEGSVPVSHPLGDVPAPYTQAELDAVAATLVNPLSGDPTALARGQLLYDRACAVCHGAGGAGDGQVVRRVQQDGRDFSRFPFAPPVNGAAAAGRSDGYLYAVIDVGRGLMPAYGERLTHLDRWAVVEYVRELQRRAGAVPQPAGATPAAPGDQPGAPAIPPTEPAAPAPQAGTR